MDGENAEYTIDVESRKVFVVDDIDREMMDLDKNYNRRFMFFDTLQRATPEAILKGDHRGEINWRAISRRRRQAYAVARDELIERGLIRG